MDQKNIKELSSTGRHQECLEICHFCIENNPKNPLAWKYAGKSLSALGEYEKAKHYLINAHNLDSLDPEVVKDLGNIFNALKDDLQAIKFYKAALSIDPNYAPALNNLGLIEQRKGNLIEAEQLIRKARDIDKSFALYHMNLGSIYKDLGNLKKALSFTLKSLEINPSNAKVHMNLGGIYKDLNNLDKALWHTLKSLELHPKNPDAYINLAGIYQDLGNLDEALASTLSSIELNPNNSYTYMNLGALYRCLGNVEDALSATLRSIELNPNNPDAYINLAGIYTDLGNPSQALGTTFKLLELNPKNSDAYVKLGSIYNDLGNSDQAIKYTLKSIELKPENHTAHMNLGAFYKLQGNLDKALSSTLRSLDYYPDNPPALKNIKAIMDLITPNYSNSEDIHKSYELLLNQTNVSHRKLTRIFLQAYLPIICAAATSDPIISDDNSAFQILSTDWKFRKSLSLMIAAHSDAERFLTSLRKELLLLAVESGEIPQPLKLLTESLAIQCFLNEYIYCTSERENEYLEKLIDMAKSSQKSTDQYLAIICCYRPMYTSNLKPELILNYKNSGDESKEFIATLFHEPLEEQKIQASLKVITTVTDSISANVRKMYEENPYPRFRHADYTENKLTTPIFEAIREESTKRDLTCSIELSSHNAHPKVLIAGCGTGNQVIKASRYKNAQITAIDLSSSSLAYAIRKAREYNMNNTNFAQMDLLNISELDEMFDVIKCSGVLHHMKDPIQGLSTLVQQLKPNGYIKLGLYSEIARKVVVNAKNTIQTLGIKSTPQGIRDFRKKIQNGEIPELSLLPQFGSDFYSLSECRDLCFHIQEHRFTIEQIKALIHDSGLTFCGFMLPSQARYLYHEEYPDDSNMTSLDNWNEFEKKYPSTFSAMYQFWAQKRF